jgi:ferredoxin
VEIEALERIARARGVDRLAIASTAEVDRHLPEGRRLAQISEQLTRVLVLARHMPNGVMWAGHPGTKQYAAARSLKMLGEAAVHLAAAIEKAGAIAMPLAPAAIDFVSRDATDLVPAGQGSLAVRTAAVQSGLGTFGLNNMVLTPEFGPRVHFAALLTDAALPAGTPLASELCLGLEACGRCAAICPQQAIPLRAPKGAALASVRGLDGAACCRSAQPFGADAFVNYLSTMFASTDRETVSKLIRHRVTGELWQEATFLKDGAYTSCMRCEDVCPVGADYAVISRSPHRQADLPDGVQRRLEAGVVRIEPTLLETPSPRT